MVKSLLSACVSFFLNGVCYGNCVARLGVDVGISCIGGTPGWQKHKAQVCRGVVGFSRVAERNPLHGDLTAFSLFKRRGVYGEEENKKT